MSSIVGIDLGTTFSCVATIAPNGEPEAIANFEGTNTTPSVVAYSDDGISVGKTAGKPLVKLTQNGKEKKLAAEEISAEVLKMMRMIAEKYLTDRVTKAVITVPANFDQRQRHATMEAAKLAGIEVMQLLNEPTAAAIAYGLHNKGTNKVLVYGFGGGTLDVSIVMCEGNNVIKVLATSGHNHLGGQDLDKIIMNYALKNFSNFPKHKAKMMKRLLDMCTEAKIALSAYETTTILIDDASSDDGWKLKLTRNKFDELCGKTIRGTIDIVNEALRQAGMNESDIDIVILAGGSTRIAMVQNLLKEKFGDEKIWKRHNPDEVVAKGAALVAKAIARSPSSNSLQLAIKMIETSIDKQESMSSDIYEGERKQCKYNFKIGNIKLNLKNQNSRKGYEIKISNGDRKKIFKLVNEYLEWAEEIPEPMELYETKMKEFAKEIRKYYPSVDETIALNKLTRDFQRTNVSD
ncbi:hypothetical protein WR25_19648 [Diploscapter pachys]|uniref:Uncharacterized protein n=1 Tax=Diploscapter pachys TaxID=2018661 RepID=A0A2A2LUB0_9BILA|nr:hypothetical protein WR25_19648 [Diploscapter pachys]